MSPITNKIVDYKTFNKHKNKLSHNESKYKLQASNRTKRMV